jgi:hypothetical protein
MCIHVKLRSGTALGGQGPSRGPAGARNQIGCGVVLMAYRFSAVRS